jgi:hypothetical protein
VRRRKDYRDDWTAHAQRTYHYVLAHVKPKHKALTPDHPQFRATGDYLRETAKPGTEQEKKVFTCIQGLRKYHLIGGLPNPAIRTPFLLSFHASFGGMYLGRGEDAEVRIEKNHVLYQFDLTRPIRPQTEQAYADLLQQQSHRRGKKEGRRLHRELFPRYLRALDARDCGATFEQIGRVLLKIDDYGDAIKRGKDLHTQALTLQDHLPLYF